MPVTDKLPRPTWPEIRDHIIDDATLSDDHATWCAIAEEWLVHTAQQFQLTYTLSNSENFILLSSADERFNKSLMIFLERCRRRLLNIAKGIVADDGLGKHVVMVFHDIDAYYDYIGFYGPDEGTYGLSSGMFLDYGYGHFVFQQDDLDQAEPIAAHEMTHALLSHLPIPAWLNEGLAVNMEGMICAVPPTPMNKQTFAQHQEYWGAEQRKHFFSGESFFNADEGQQLSYQLAQVLVSNLSRDYDTFVKFANLAHFEDGGEAALEKVYGLGLNELLENLLGTD